MRSSEQFMERIECTFSAFCKVVLRNEAINAYRDFRRQQMHEISLDYLMSETPFEPFTTDNYFEQYDKCIYPCLIYLEDGKPERFANLDERM